MINNQEFKDFLTTLNPDSNIKKVQDKLEILTSDFKDYFYFNTYSFAFHMSDKKNWTSLSFTFSFFIPQVNSKESIEVSFENKIEGEKKHGKIRLTSFKPPILKVEFNEVEPFNAGVKMYSVEPQYQAIYEELSTDDTNMQFSNKEINSCTKAEHFTEYVNKARNEYILPYLLSSMQNDWVEIKMGGKMIGIYMPKKERMNFIKGVSDACTKLIDDILNPESSPNFKPLLKALDEHDRKNHAQLLEKQLPVKETSKRLKKI